MATSFDDPVSGAQPRVERGEVLVTVSREVLAKLQVVGAVALAVALGIIAQKQLVEEQQESRGLILWGVALCLFLYGLWRARSIPVADDATAKAENPVQERTISLSAEAALLAGAFAIGVFFSFYRLGAVPPGLNHDAAWEGLHAIRIGDGYGAPYSPYVPEAWGRETMFHYFVAFIQTFLGPTKLAIQLSATIIGLATLPLFYLMLRRLFDTRLALIGAFLLGVSGWHITMNRVGWRSSLVPLFYALVFYFLLKAVQERRPRDFALAGIFLGLSIDTYDAARIIPFIAGAYLLYEIARSPKLIRTSFPHLTLFSVAAIIAFSPLGWYALNHWDDFTGRSKFLWIGAQVEEAGSLEPLFTNIKNSLLMFNFRANGDDFFTHEPLLDLPVSVFFTLGLAYSVTRFRQRGHFLLLAMLALTLAVGVAARPNGNRNIGALIPTTAFAAIFLFESWRWLSEAYPRYKDWCNAALVGVLLYVGWATYDSYLGPDRREQWGFYPETTRVGRYMDKIAPEYEIYAAAGNWPRDALTYLSYQGEGDPFANIVYQYTTEATELLNVALAWDKGTAFIIENTPQNIEVFETLRSEFPSAATDRIFYPDGSDNAIANVLLVPPGGGSGARVEEGPALPGAAERDAERRADLQRIAAALVEYRNRTGGFPSTSNNPQTACAYLDLDALCQFRDQLGIETLLDPRGEPTEYGYWYASDGNSFTLYAMMDGSVSPEERCKASDPGLASRPNLLCLHLGD